MELDRFQLGPVYYYVPTASLSQWPRPALEPVQWMSSCSGGQVRCSPSRGIYGGNFRNGCDALFGRHVVGFLNNCNIVCSCAVTLLRFGSLDVTLELYGELPNAITFMKRDAEEKPGQVLLKLNHQEPAAQHLHVRRFPRQGVCRPPFIPHQTTIIGPTTSSSWTIERKLVLP